MIPELNKLHLMDCMEGMKLIPDKSIDLIFADPWYYPKNQNTKNAFEDDIFWGITKKWMIEFSRLIKKSGHIFVSFSSQKMAKFEFLIAEIQMPLRSRIIWHYRNAGGRCADKGQFGKTYEMIYHIGYGKTLNFPEKWTDERFDVWTISTPQANYSDKKIHPYQKPKELLERIIKIGSYESDLILDPFMGSGTTAIAAINLNRHWIGFEIDKDYHKAASERIEIHKQQLKLNL